MRSFSVLLLLAFSALYAAEDCKCTCSGGNEGTYSVTSCDDCDADGCRSNVSGCSSASSVSASCSSSGGGGGTDYASAWIGKYKLSGSCPSSCCCLSTVDVTKDSDTSVTASGPLSGAGCGDLDGHTVTESITGIDSKSSIDYTTMGQSFTWTRTKSGIKSENNDFPACNVDYTGGNGASSTVPALLAGVAVLVAVRRLT